MMFLKIKNLIWDNRLILALAFIAGAVYIAPNIYFSHFNEKFSGIHFSGLDAEAHYLAMVKEVSEGYLRQASTYLYEYKNEYWPLAQYSENMYGVVIRAFNISAPLFYLSSKFIFPVINFLLWYALSIFIIKDRRGAVLSALLFSFGYYLAVSPGLFSQWLTVSGQNGSISVLPYSRFINPMLTYLFFFSGLICLFRQYERPSFKNAVFFGLALGICYYIYFYFWVFLAIAAGLVFLAQLAGKNLKAAKSTAAGLFISLLIGGFFIFEMLKVAYLGVFEDLSAEAFSAFLASRRLIFSKTVIIALAVFSAYLFYKKRKKEIIDYGDKFALLLLLAAIIVVNQQVITGRLIEEGHFHWYTNLPAVFLGLSLVASYVINKIKSKKIKSALYAAMFIYLIAFGIGTQASGYKNSASRFIYYQNYGPVFSWLNKNSQPESVVLANDEISNLIPAYTGNNVYYAPYALFYPSNPLKRRIHSVYVYSYLNRNREEAEPELNDAQELEELISRYVYYRYTYGESPGAPAWLKEKIISGYNDFLAMPFEQELKQYRIDYLVWDRTSEPQWQIDEFEFVRLIFSQNNIEIYQVL